MTAARSSADAFTRSVSRRCDSVTALGDLRLARRGAGVVEALAQLADLPLIRGLIAAAQVRTPAGAVVDVRHLVGEQVVEDLRDLLLPAVDQDLAAVRGGAHPPFVGGRVE